jgi:hypothetical protein
MQLKWPITAALKAGQMRKLYRAGFAKAEISRQLQIGYILIRSRSRCSVRAH